jgi:peroxiredoxin
MRINFEEQQYIMKFFTAFATLLLSLSLSAQDKPEGLFINSKAPDFKAKDQSGVEVNLKELRKKGPVVLVFYRGNWCPYCNKELKRLQDSLHLIMAKGAQLIAITPEGAEGVGKTIEKTGALFPILTDADMKIAKSYSVSYDVDEKTANRYKSFGTDLLQINNQKSRAFLPVPAVYVISKEGSITYRFFDADYRKRPNVQDILKNLNVL